MYEDQWDALQQLIRNIPVDGGEHWNCQDYVFGIWEAAAAHGIADDDTWREGEASLRTALQHSLMDYSRRRGRIIKLIEQCTNSWMN